MLYGMFYIQIIHGLALGLYSTYYYYLCSIIFYNVLQLGPSKLSEVVDLCSQPQGQILEFGLTTQISIFKRHHGSRNSKNYIIEVKAT